MRAMTDNVRRFSSGNNEPRKVRRFMPSYELKVGAQIVPVNYAATLLTSDGTELSVNQ